jgi:hypothetical protein
VALWICGPILSILCLSTTSTYHVVKSRVPGIPFEKENCSGGKLAFGGSESWLPTKAIPQVTTLSHQTSRALCSYHLSRSGSSVPNLPFCFTYPSLSGRACACLLACMAGLALQHETARLLSLRQAPPAPGLFSLPRKALSRLLLLGTYVSTRIPLGSLAVAASAWKADADLVPSR